MVETPGMRVRGLSCVGGSVGVWRVGTVLLLVLLLAVLLAGRADATPQIKVHCEVYATNHVDPIALVRHLHRQIGNTSTTNSSTGESLFNNLCTSCNEGGSRARGGSRWRRRVRTGRQRLLPCPRRPDEDQGYPQGLATARNRAEWLPRERYSKYNCKRRTVPGHPAFRLEDQLGHVDHLPRLHQNDFGEPGHQRGLQPQRRVPEHAPLPHPQDQLPRYARPTPMAWCQTPCGSLPGWTPGEPYTFMHADYFAANQPVFNNQLLALCLVIRPGSRHLRQPQVRNGASDGHRKLA